jgi:hypothetical protein
MELSIAIPSSLPSDVCSDLSLENSEDAFPVRLHCGHNVVRLFAIVAFGSFLLPFCKCCNFDKITKRFYGTKALATRAVRETGTDW